MILSAQTMNGTVPLTSPVFLRLDRGEDAPADSFRGVFPISSPVGALTEITVNNNGRVWFDGIVDEQSETLTSSGLTLTVSARSRAALLLDNEALPQNYVNPSLKTIFERHVAPYGFTGFSGDTLAYAGTLAITKGMSEWQAAALFCTKFLNVTPRIRGKLFDASGQSVENSVRFAPREGLCFSSAEVLRRPCSLYSELYRISSDGTVTLAAADTKAEVSVVRRRRFLTGSGTDAKALLNKAKNSSFAICLKCPGEIRAPLYAPARVELPVLGVLDSLYVSAVSYRLDSGGERCKVTLRRN